MNTNSPARAGAEEEMRMGTEDELIEKIGQAIYDAVESGGPDDPAAAAIAALGVPMSVLAWITANPEAAKGLASGEMAAVPTEATPEMADAARMFLEPCTVRVGQIVWRAMLAASPPALSDKAQGETT